MKISNLLLALAAASSLVHAASFDCKKAATFVEKEICNDSLLEKLDDALGGNYKSMLGANIGSGAKKDLKATQRVWLSVRDKCTNKQCLVDTYRKRIDEVCDYPVIAGVHPVCTSSDEIN